MSETKHTPGPWLIAPEDKAFVYALGPGGTNSFWAHVQTAGRERIERAETEANAHLIAAAPDLLAELRNIAEADPAKWEPDVRGQFREWAQSRARAAVAKATR